MNARLEEIARLVAELDTKQAAFRDVLREVAADAERRQATASAELSAFVGQVERLMLTLAADRLGAGPETP
jgi:uncharacterized protein (UPF0335 family)